MNLVNLEPAASEQGGKMDVLPGTQKDMLQKDR